MLDGVPLNDVGKLPSGMGVLGDVPATLIGSANGGLEFKLNMNPETGSSTRNPYPARKTVFPEWNMSQAKPTRGWKFLLFWA